MRLGMQAILRGSVQREQFLLLVVQEVLTRLAQLVLAGVLEEQEVQISAVLQKQEDQVALEQMQPVQEVVEEELEIQTMVTPGVQAFLEEQEVLGALPAAVTEELV